MTRAWQSTDVASIAALQGSTSSSALGTPQVAPPSSLGTSHGETEKERRDRINNEIAHSLRDLILCIELRAFGRKCSDACYLRFTAFDIAILDKVYKGASEKDTEKARIFARAAGAKSRGYTKWSECELSYAFPPEWLVDESSFLYQLQKFRKYYWKLYKDLVDSGRIIPTTTSDLAFYGAFTGVEPSSGSIPDLESLIGSVAAPSESLVEDSGEETDRPRSALGSQGSRSGALRGGSTSSEMVEVTKLPPNKTIKVEHIKVFDGNLADLESFNNSIKQMLIRNNLPLYYGGVVSGDPDSDYEYVPRTMGVAKANYVIGRRLCAAISSRFEKTALKWWEDYDSAEGSVPPNCWRKNSDMKNPPRHGVPENVEEVSLYDFLKKHFNSDMDAREAELELNKFRWKPFEKDGMNVTVARGHIERLMKRAQKVGTFARVKALQNCLPQKFRDKVEMEESEDVLWQKIGRIYVTMEVDMVDAAEVRKKCTGCGMLGHEVETCRRTQKSDNNKSDANKALSKANSAALTCTYRSKKGHEKAACYSKKRDVANGQQPAAKLNISTTSPATAGNAGSTNAAGGVSSGAKVQTTLLGFVKRTCYNCGEEGHLSRWCTKPRQMAVQAVEVVPETKEKKVLVKYNIPTPVLADFLNELYVGSSAYRFDERSICWNGSEPATLPLHHVMSKIYHEREVFEVDKIPDTEVRDPTGCLWSMSSTAMGQQLLTVWDTGLVVAVVPFSTIEKTNTAWVNTSDVEFVLAEGSMSNPIGHAPKFLFRLGDVYYALKVYIVREANYQLLLGTSFMVKVGAALFPRWERVLVTIPVRLSIHAVNEGITADVAPPPLKEETAVLGDEEFVPLPTESLKDGVKVPLMNITVGEKEVYMWKGKEVDGGIRIGYRDLVAEVDEEIECEMKVPVSSEGNPVITVEFIMDQVKFGPSVPDEVRRLICGDIIEFSNAFSWNQYNLGTISDVPTR
ncbi:hypothetical protein DFH27DRAFT_605918 [Peziza echinospora]|nr:hypothetical protein DFH27DRAFT_605918 [Peziza echinospora]